MFISEIFDIFPYSFLADIGAISDINIGSVVSQCWLQSDFFKVHLQCRGLTKAKALNKPLLVCVVNASDGGDRAAFM